MARRGENIRKRKDGRWEARHLEGYKENGAPRYKSIYGKSYSEVKKSVQLYIALGEAEKSPSRDDIDLTYLANAWLNSQKIKIKDSSHARYHWVIETHILPYFQNIELQKLSSKDVEDFVLFLATEGRKDGKGGLSPKVVNDIGAVLLQILRYGQRHEFLTQAVSEPALPTNSSRETKVLSQHEQNALLKYASHHINPTTLGIMIALHTGIRLGELCALQWSDFDFSANLLRITKTAQRIADTTPGSKTKTKLIIDKPKSEKSNRTIPLQASLMDFITKNVSTKEDSCYILSGTRKMVEPRQYQNRFKRILKEAELPNFGFHSLRHTFATRAVEAGFEIKSLSEILGHSTVRFTLDRYVHSSERLKRENMEKLELIFPGLKTGS